MIQLSNEKRGCGNLVRGALYMGAQLGLGPLAKWAWMLGKLWDSDEGESIRYSPDVLPDRQQVEIDWAGTKAAGRLTDEPVGKDDPLFAVADHIGSCHYTPMEFYQETIERGPNRRIRRDTAKLWAKNTPFPILFGSKDIPWFDSQEHAAELETELREEALAFHAESGCANKHPAVGVDIQNAIKVELDMPTAIKYSQAHAPDLLATKPKNLRSFKSYFRRQLDADNTVSEFVKITESFKVVLMRKKWTGPAT